MDFDPNEYVSYDGLPGVSFDNFTDMDMFINFNDAGADGPDPEAAVASTDIPQIPTEATLPSADALEVFDCESIFRLQDAEDTSATAHACRTSRAASIMLPLPADEQLQQYTPAPGAQPSIPLAQQQQLTNPATEADKEGCSTESLLAEFTEPHLDTLSLPWATDEVDPSSFIWNTGMGNDLTGGMGIFNPPLDWSEFQNAAYSTPTNNYTYPSPMGTQVSTAQATQAQPPPTSQASLTSFLADLSSVSAGELPYTFNEDAVDLLTFTLPPMLSLTGPQGIADPTTSLQQPQPVASLSPGFIKTEEDDKGSLAPSSIIDPRGHIKTTPVSATSSPGPGQTPKRDLSTPVVNGKVIKRIPRPAKAKDVNAADWYETLPTAPTPWGGSDPVKNPLFQYNAFGEWWPGLRFSRDDILYYLTERKRLNLPLTIWIQNLPHGCVNRVADGRTLKCRWDGCPAQNATILKGFWRVCFDERPATSGRQHNPFHNAGYMHLWCLDRCFDLFEISQAFDLKPDTRHFEKEERNPMAMTRDHDELVMEFEHWRTSQKESYEEWRALCEKNDIQGLPTENRVVEREQKLWYILTEKHLDLETGVRQAMRDNRGGISIDQHKGDVGWYSKKVNEKKKKTKARKEAGSRALAKLGDLSELLSEDEDIQETRVSKPRSRVAKKAPLPEVKSEETDKENAGDHPKPAGRPKRPRADDGDERDSELKEIGSNKRQRGRADEGDKSDFEGDDHKRQRRHRRSV